MCMGGAIKTPPAPPAPTPPPPVPKLTDPAVKRARQENRQVAALASGRNANILTSPQGLMDPASTAKKTALGT